MGQLEHTIAPFDEEESLKGNYCGTKNLNSGLSDSELENQEAVSWSTFRKTEVMV